MESNMLTTCLSLNLPTLHPHYTSTPTFHPHCQELWNCCLQESRSSSPCALALSFRSLAALLGESPGVKPAPLPLSALPPPHRPWSPHSQACPACSLLPYFQTFRIFGSHVAHFCAYSHTFTDFCLEYLLGKLGCFIHICYKKTERGKRSGIVLYTRHQRLRIFRMEQNVVNGCCFEIKRLCKAKKKKKKNTINLRTTSSLKRFIP